MQEALRLLNRLASHPAYSVALFKELTSSRDLISMAIDIATRLSKKCRRLLNFDRQIREHEVVNLASLFKKRISTFLGENISSWNFVSFEGVWFERELLSKNLFSLFYVWLDKDFFITLQIFSSRKGRISIFLHLFPAPLMVDFPP